jgi:large subunit ribosomal protein L28
MPRRVVSPGSGGLQLGPPGSPGRSESNHANECYFTGKRTRFGKKRAYGGQKIKKGGFGLKTTGIARRTFKPNLQTVNAVVEENGKTKVKRVKASAHAIRSGLVVKPLKRKYGYTRLQKEEG